MQVTHSLTIKARCPVDHKIDVYIVEVTSSVVVKVEDILAEADKFKSREIFQEDLTEQLARALGCTVKTVGYHSGVKTEVVA